MRAHFSNERLAQDRGLVFGQAHSDAVQRTVRAYERLFHEVRDVDTSDIRHFGEAVAVRLGNDWPHAAQEIAGIASGAEVDEATLMAVNARTELLAGAGPPECSAIGVLPQRSGGPTLLAQNWDWHPSLADCLVVWTLVEPDGRWLSTMTEAGILAKIGLNSRGLGLCLNILGSSRDGGPKGTPVHVLMRLVLQRCDDLADVHELLADNHVSASSSLNVGMPGALVSFELSPASVRRIEPEDGVLLHTNHFLEAPDDAEDLYRRDRPDTVARLEELERWRREGPRRIDAGAVKHALRSHERGVVAICCHDPDNERYADRQESLASICLNLDQRRFELSDGPPCRTPYERVGRGGRLAAVVG
jgi:isopenicillin-N N-acyltransferase-like protein